MTTKQEAVEGEAVAEVPEAFHVHDAATANWVVRKVVDARQYAERVQAWADAELRGAKREEEFFLFRFGAQLERWAREQLASEKARFKSVFLPAGTVGFRTRPARLCVAEEEAVLAWCKQKLPAAIAVQERLLKDALQEHVEATGECPAGVVIEAGAEVFYVR